MNIHPFFCSIIRVMMEFSMPQAFFLEISYHNKNNRFIYTI